MLADYRDFRPGVVQALNDADLVFSQEMAPGLPMDVLHHPLGRGLRRRFFQGGLVLLRSFVTTTKPQPSLIHNLKFVPSELTGDGHNIGCKKLVRALVNDVPATQLRPRSQPRARRMGFISR